MLKRRLLAPGPTPVPEEGLLRQAQPMYHHRTPEFRALLTEVMELLKYVYQTKNDSVIFVSAGTGAMEASVVNVLAPQDTALVVRGGKFGERWTELCEAYGRPVVNLDIPWSEAVSPDALSRALKAHPEVKAVYTQLCETSTGVLTDVAALSPAVHQAGALLVVDGISAVGAVEFRMDDWGVDALVVGSQKALMAPPGLATATLSSAAWERVKANPSRGYYFDLLYNQKGLAAYDPAFTPAITLFEALRVGLRLLRTEGMEQVWARHRVMAEGVRAGVRAMGLAIYPKRPSDSLTAITLPEGVDGDKVVKMLRDEEGFIIAGGQGKLKGKLCRIAHMGYIDSYDCLVALAALERVLRRLGVKLPASAGVAAASDYYCTHGAAAAKS
jgi:aspartate aminotransferase-like enzyme